MKRSLTEADGRIEGSETAEADVKGGKRGTGAQFAVFLLEDCMQGGVEGAVPRFRGDWHGGREHDFAQVNTRDCGEEDSKRG